MTALWTLQRMVTEDYGIRVEAMRGELKILDPVVVFDTVPMMDNLAPYKRALEISGHDETVFSHTIL
jgi:hypothetical protein